MHRVMVRPVAGECGRGSSSLPPPKLKVVLLDVEVSLSEDVGELLYNSSLIFSFFSV